MNGIRFWRLKRHMSYAALCKAANCSYGTIRRLEEEIADSTSSALLLRLADALGVTLDQLVMDYPADAVSWGDHPVPKRTSDKPLNTVGRYCRHHNLTLTELARLLGKRSKQAAQHTCIKPTLKPEDILPLARREGVSVEDFISRY